MKPPKHFMYDGPRSRMIADTAGVESRPPCVRRAHKNKMNGVKGVQRAEIDPRRPFMFTPCTPRQVTSLLLLLLLLSHR
jgi:hypothetical protein